MLRTKSNAGFLLGFIFLATISVSSYSAIGTLLENAAWVTHTVQVKVTAEDFLSQMKDLETGQRGYLITGEDEYLAPFESALKTVDTTLNQLQTLTLDNENEQHRINELKGLKDKKIAELKKTISLRKHKGFDSARQVVRTDVGKEFMDRIRVILSEIKAEEQRLLVIRNEKTANSTQLSEIIIVAGGILANLILIIAAIMVSLTEKERFVLNRKLEDQNWIRSGLIQLNEKLIGDQSITALAKNTIETLVNTIQGQAGAIYITDDNGVLQYTGGYGSQPETSPKELKLGDSLVGQAALQKSPISILDVPKDYLKIRSALGEASPASVHILPFLHEDAVKGVIEVGALSPLSETRLEYLKLGLDGIGVAFNSAQSRYKIKALLEEAQAQSEELQVQQAELKATNEELEEQRSELEERTEKLEETNREIQKARKEIEAKSIEVERASKYKSEFLANMSHELRTPLNAILLLSKSFTEESEENVSQEQREVFETIYSSGADLLSLINDILDLSRVEAGKLDVKVGEVKLSDLAESMETLFRQQMKQKGLTFLIEISKFCPKTIITDRFRLEQILKNFLSNSLKFTESGKVVLSFERPKKETDLSASRLDPESAIALSVTDTGVGIPKDKKEKIFGAFEQVDNTSSRKFGGAGLGLTISKKLSQLLGGEIQLESTFGTGSRFVIFLPESFRPENSQPENFDKDELSGRREGPSSEDALSSKARTGAHGIEDDRKNLGFHVKSILVIEDDPNYAKILYKHCHSHGFKCLLAADGESGLEDAIKFLPSAIILDLKLPGMNGMDVRNKLRGTAKTRNIPVHTMSVDDRGSQLLKEAIGFLEKPASKEGIEAVFRKIAESLSSKAGRVLVVEDQKIERENILRLIGSIDVKSVGVESAHEALEQLKSGSFDCMIMDLNLSDMSGFSLLEEIEKVPSIARPPVIVYTSQDLNKNEFEKLNEFSTSIIVKGIRSEERLLDELTLFFHNVKANGPQEGEQETVAPVNHREEIFKDKKLLLVDDDMRNIYALRGILLKKGFQVQAAKTGQEALEKLAAQPDTDLVLMDIMMPVMDGYEAMRHIRSEKRFNTLPIIALTAKAMSSDRDECLKAGANDYLSKPIDLDALLSLLRVWLSR